MTKLKIFFLSILFLLAALVSYSESYVRVTFINNTGYTIRELYISPTSHDDWYDNLLKGSAVPNGESIEITIPEYNADSYVYDLMAVDTEGDSYSKYEVDLTDPAERKIELTFDDYEDNTSGDNNMTDSDYNNGYRDGYRDAYRDAYSEAYKEGYKAGLSEAQNGAQ